ncbi:unnamed protein product [Kuraishia capsulata CBS 1993]|uniref:Granaticin polyketide synthase ketoacyl reductase 2 n=1 Tax=Kuraishia capsulata CBS 1993 TaxID=1382522 RepID=W6MWA7_9ASCO|nr:uncharacterized protein KUCA_T00003092001 [Kuraishia capsulata CBS 1993]CDK27115.1 unnamed protein product [Kuraishia capsulata CBS 1993]
MPIDLKGKVALITGGSAGLGAEVAVQLAQEGVDLAINYANSRERAENLQKKIETEYDVKVVLIQASIFEAGAAELLVAKTIESFGRLDIVVSNAGWTKVVPYEDLDALDEELWDGCFNANVKSHFYLYKAAKKHLEANEDGGCFLVSASVAGRIVYGSSIPYAVSKSALIHLVKFLAKTQGTKIRVHAICPGLLLTEWGQKFGPERIKTATDQTPIKKLPELDECASHYIHLAKLSSSTGTVVAIDGGVSV